MESAGQSRLELTLRDLRQLANVDLPCFVNSSSTGLAMLGGEDSVSTSIAKGTNAQFRFPTNNKCAPNLISSSVDVNGLLVRVRRKKSDSSVSVSCVGVVKKSIAFNEPADYQFLPSCSSTSYYQTEEAAEHPVLETAPAVFNRALYAPGTFLSLTDNLKIPDQVQPRKSAPATAGSAVDGSDGEDDDAEGDEPTRSAKKRHPDQGLTSFIRFGDPIPQRHAHGEYPVRWKGKPSTFRGYQMLARIRQAFDVIPMLTQVQVQGMLAIEPQNMYLFQDCLHYAAYCFSQGPYRGLWVRFGYDPAQHPEARLYQTFVFRLSPVVLADVSKKVIDHIGSAADCILDLDSLTVKELSSSAAAASSSSSAAAGSAGILSMFGIPLKTQFTVQLYMLSDPDLLSFIGRLSPARQGTGKDGWFSSSQVAEMRSLVLKCITDKIELFLGSPAVVEKRRLATLVDHAALASFDPAEVARYLREEQQQEGGSGMDVSGQFEPSVMLHWMRRYQRALARTDSEYTAEADLFISQAREVTVTPAKPPKVVKPKKPPAPKTVTPAKAAAKQSAPSSASSIAPAVVNPASSSATSARALERVSAFDVFGGDDDDDEEEEEESEEEGAVDVLHSQAFSQASALLPPEEGSSDVQDFMAMVQRLRK